jgi:xanthine dehydrogenase accessory factor
VEILVEYMGAGPHVLICGGGHVGFEVARLCDQLEYIHSVLDDRPEFAGRERFPGARHLFVDRPESFFPANDVSEFSHVILVGYSHRLDTEALYQCVKRCPGYIGLICSRLKRREMFERLRSRGVSEEELSRVEAPLGVAIGAETPAEIAVSILGGIIRHHKGVAVEVETETEKEKARDGEQNRIREIEAVAPGR